MLRPEQEEELAELFHRAIELSAAEREELLRQGPGSSPEVASRLRELLEEDERGTIPLLDPGRARLRIRTEVGPYVLLELLGAGGMGTVYLAEQREPVRRRVALKMIRPGLDGDAVKSRFEAERQALALMDHPGIARIYDGGVSEDGVPYFAMEYVEGRPITVACMELRLSTDARILLFVKVCEAVMHAHQKGIVHRDLKPGNVLVVERDGEPAPKIIDFGIARAVSGSLLPSAHATVGSALGSYAYMSPEQAAPEGRPLDTRADIYSLGVILYELLVGEPPFDPGELASKGLAQIQRVLLDETPPPPSARFQRLEESVAESRARERATTPAALAHRLRGDLDWIVMRTLEKEPSRRYASASELQQDLLRHLRHEPVTAGPPTTRYRIGKFVHRHRVGVAMGGLVLVSLVAAVVGTSLALLQTARARERERELRAEVEYQAEKAGAIVEFLKYGLLFTHPASAQDELTVRQMLERAEPEISRRFQGKPGAEAAVRYQVGMVYMLLGDVERADQQFSTALEKMDLAPHENPLDLFKTLARLIHTKRHVEGPAAADSLQERCMAVALDLLAGHPELVAALRAAVSRAEQEPSPSLPLERLEAVDAVVGAGDGLTQDEVYVVGWILASVATQLHDRWDLKEESRAYLDLVIDLAPRALTPGRMETISALWFVAHTYVLPDDPDFRAALFAVSWLDENASQVLHPAHWIRIDAKRIEGAARAGLGQYGEAERALVLALAGAEAEGGAPSMLPRVRDSLIDLAGRAPSDFLGDSLERWRAARSDDPACPTWWVVRFPGAPRPVYEQAAALLEDAGEGPTCGMALVRAGRFEEGLEHLRSSELPTARPFRILARWNLGRPEQAREDLEALLGEVGEPGSEMRLLLEEVREAVGR